MTDRIGIVTIFHNERNQTDARVLEALLEMAHPEVPLIKVDNSVTNRGFAGGCNLGAQSLDTEILGFLNPDVRITGSFTETILAAFQDPNIVITGSNFGKQPAEYQRFWGCRDWVCGAAFFVRRDWFLAQGGFDEGYVWGWEETDLIRRAQSQGLIAKSLSLPLAHKSPDQDSFQDAEYKRKHFNAGSVRFYGRWGNERR